MRQLTYLLLFLFISKASAQENIIYQKPPKEILDLVDVQLAPSVLLNDNKEYMVLLYRNAYKTIEELSREELRLGGLRIDPKTNIGSRVSYYNNVKIKNIKQKNAEVIQVNGLPQNPGLTNFTWSPDQKRIAFTNTTLDGVEIWILDLADASVNRLTEARINANMGDVINWFEDSQSFLVKMLPEERENLIDRDEVVPEGPTISVNEGEGTKQDLSGPPGKQN